ncbi:MAG: prephenate dehydratase [Candidatus Anstonellales archaeon]
MNLDEIRKNIDQIDLEILRLLNKRNEFALRAKRFKKEIEDPRREQEVLEIVRKSPTFLLKKEFVDKLFSDIISESKRIQSEVTTLVGFQGEHGAYSEIAAFKYTQNASTIPCNEFSDVFNGVKSGTFDMGVVPVENSIGGSIADVNDLLIETDLNVVGEVTVPIHHCLLSIPETDYRDIKVVYSHPQALSQCKGFISRNKLEAIPYYDTAGSAMMLSQSRPKAAAAIASKLCADIYGLEILKENIEDSGPNITRFLVISKQKEKGGNKCSAVFSTPHKAGALFGVLKIFAEAGINLTRIESRPIPSKPKQFAFLLDFLGSDSDPTVVSAIEKATKECEYFRLLGCYKKAVDW